MYIHNGKSVIFTDRNNVNDTVNVNNTKNINNTKNVNNKKSGIKLNKNTYHQKSCSKFDFTKPIRDNLFDYNYQRGDLVREP